MFYKGKNMQNFLENPFLIRYEIFCIDMVLGIPLTCKTQLILDLNSVHYYFKFKPLNKISLCTHSCIEYLNVMQGDVNIGYEVEKLITKYPEVFTDQIGKAVDCKVGYT